MMSVYCPNLPIEYLDQSVTLVDSQAVAVPVHPKVIYDVCPLLPGPCGDALADDQRHVDPAVLTTSLISAIM